MGPIWKPESRFGRNDVNESSSDRHIAANLPVVSKRPRAGIGAESGSHGCDLAKLNVRPHLTVVVRRQIGKDDKD